MLSNIDSLISHNYKLHEIQKAIIIIFLIEEKIKRTRKKWVFENTPLLLGNFIQNCPVNAPRIHSNEGSNIKPYPHQIGHRYGGFRGKISD